MKLSAKWRLFSWLLTTQTISAGISSRCTRNNTSLKAWSSFETNNAIFVLTELSNSSYVILWLANSVSNAALTPSTFSNSKRKYKLPSVSFLLSYSVKWSKCKILELYWAMVLVIKEVYLLYPYMLRVTYIYHALLSTPNF